MMSFLLATSKHVHPGRIVCILPQNLEIDIHVIYVEGDVLFRFPVDLVFQFFLVGIDGRTIFLMITAFPDMEDAASFALMSRSLTSVFMVSTMEELSMRVLSTMASAGSGKIPTLRQRVDAFLLPDLHELSQSSTRCQCRLSL